MPLYKKEEVTILGDVKQGDLGFSPGAALVRIKRKDGSEEVVPKTEVT
jgi:hypothetical protein